MFKINFERYGSYYKVELIMSNFKMNDSFKVKLILLLELILFEIRFCNF